MARRRIYKQENDNPFWNYLLWLAVAAVLIFGLLNVFPQTRGLLGGKGVSSANAGSTTNKVVGSTKGLGKSIKDKF